MISKNIGINVIGEGTISAVPDTVTITLGTVTENTDLQTAQSQNGVTVTHIIQALLSLGITRDELKTIDYRVEPKYVYEDGKQNFQGYRVSNMMNISTKNIRDIGRIVDTAVNNGANSVTNIQFSIVDSTSLYQSALIQASKDAMKKPPPSLKHLEFPFTEFPIQSLKNQSVIFPFRFASK